MHELGGFSCKTVKFLDKAKFAELKKTRHGPDLLGAGLGSHHGLLARSVEEKGPANRRLGRARCGWALARDAAQARAVEGRGQHGQGSGRDVALAASSKQRKQVDGGGRLGAFSGEGAAT